MADILFFPLARSVVDPGRQSTTIDGMKVTNVGETMSFRASCFTRVYPASIYRTLFTPISIPLVLSSSPTIPSPRSQFTSDFFSGFTPASYYCSCHGWRINDVVRHDVPPLTSTPFFTESLRRSVLRFRLTRRYSWRPRLPDIRFIMLAMYIVLSVPCSRLQSRM